MRNRFLIIVMLFAAAVSAFGQGGSVNRQVIAPTVSNNGTGQPASFANIRFCPSTATGFPCSPLIANVFSDQALTQGLPAAFAADVNGNYTVFVPTGTYLVQESNAVGAGYTFQYSWFWFVNGTGTVSSVSLSMPSIFTITGSPCTTVCNFTVGLVNAPALDVFANCTGSPALPAFCLLTANMLPTTLNATTINGLTVNGNETVSGTLGVTGTVTFTNPLIVGGLVTASTSVITPFINATTGYQISGSYGSSGQALISTGVGTTFGPVAASSVLIISCGTSVASTIYCGNATQNNTEFNTSFPIPRNGTLSKMYCFMSPTPSFGQAIVVALDVGTPSGMSSTGITCTMNPGNNGECFDGTHSFSASAIQLMDILVSVSGGATAANVSCSVNLS